MGYEVAICTFCGFLAIAYRIIIGENENRKNKGNVDD
jgi:hypothetical protein